MEGKTARGASSPAKPAFTSPEPLSHTRAVVSSSSHILAQLRRGLQMESGAAGAQCPRWRCPPRPEEGPEQGRRVGAAEGAPAVPFPSGQQRRAGKRLRTPRRTCVEKESPSAPGARTCRHPFASPPQPFTALPSHTLRAPLGPHPHPPAKPQLEGNAHESRDPRCPGRGAAGHAICAPLFCHHPGPNK